MSIERLLHIGFMYFFYLNDVDTALIQPVCAQVGCGVARLTLKVNVTACAETVFTVNTAYVGSIRSYL